MTFDYNDYKDKNDYNEYNDYNDFNDYFDYQNINKSRFPAHNALVAMQLCPWPFRSPSWLEPVTMTRDSDLDLDWEQFSEIVT